MSRITRRGGRIVISDLHPDAAKAGWKRGFRAGNHEYELMHTMHSADLIHRCGRSANLLQSWELSARFDTPERLIFAAAGKEQVFENARRIHALRMTEWRKR
jgi:hypothetical protein